MSLHKTKNITAIKEDTIYAHPKTEILNCYNRKFFPIPVSGGSTVVFENYADFMSFCEENENNLDSNNIKKSIQGYGRYGNVTTLCVEQIIANFEEAFYSKILSSGIAAIRVAIISFISYGGHILLTDGIYGASKDLIDYLCEKFNITCTYFDPMVTENDLKKLIKPNTQLIYCESPSTRFFEVADVGMIAKIAEEFNIPSVFDNSYSTWANFKPLKYGFDISVCSLTKYACGHSDMMSGSLSVNEKYFKRILKSINLQGDVVSAEQASKLARSIKTMNIRMKHSSSVCKDFINYLKQSKLISKIYHPSIETSVGYDNFQKYFLGVPSLLSVALDKIYPEEKLEKMYNSFKIFKMGISYGGVESLIIPLYNNDKTRLFSKNQPSLNSSMRIYIGFENITDLIYDFEEAIKNLK